ncbi:MAG: hypothetical protein ACRDEA_22215 [Microcystaceae cyanobacterium]
MTGKVLDRDATGILVIILPLAVAIVVLFTAWHWILLFIGLSLAWQLWKTYQWQQWCQQVNPFFNQLIKDNRGCLTPMDLSLKANMTAISAQRFLEKKAEEYGAQRKVLEGTGTVYYFLTASALGGIFDDSEPILEEPESGSLAQKKILQIASGLPVADFSHPSSASNIAPQPASTSPKPVEIDADELRVVKNEIPLDTASNIEEPLTFQEHQKPQEHASTAQKKNTSGLIQADLAKRLDLNPSTVGRRKSEPDFPAWSQSKDPDGIGWKYIPKTKMFVPVETE